MTDLSALRTSQGGRTPEFGFVRGEYAISGEAIPYFSVNMTAAQAFTHLKLARDLAVNPDDPIHLDELMQRDIDLKRTNGEIVEYLKAPHRLKFFNSLTVVLMPVDAQGAPLQEFADGAPDTSTAQEEFVGTELLEAGPVRLRQVPGTNFGLMSWDISGASAVIIDGQHRFVAMETVRRDMPALLQADTTRVPILILVLDPRVGYKPPPGGPEGIVKASRSIFTDINKHAIKVSADREYLLDDLTLEAVAMREILTPGIGKTDKQKVFDLPGRFPLALVDWNRARRTTFHEGPFVSTIQSVYALVAEVITSSQPSANAYSELRVWIEELAASYDTESSPGWDTPAILARIVAAEEEGLPFSLHGSEVKVAAEGFATSMGQVIVQVLLRAKPYNELIEKYFELGLLGEDKELWLGQTSDGRATWVAQFGENPAPATDEAADEIKRRYEYAYQVVFQRGFVLAALQVAGAIGEIKPVLELDDADGVAELVIAWLDRFNSQVAPHLADPGVWSGAALMPDGKTNFGQVSKKAIAGLSILLTLDWDSVDPVMSSNDTTLLAGSRDDEILALIDGDPLRIRRPTKAQIEWVGRWRRCLDSVVPGPITSDLARLRREAISSYRAGLRRHVALIAQSAGRELTAGERDLLVLAYGARRLAHTLG